MVTILCSQVQHWGRAQPSLFPVACVADWTGPSLSSPRWLSAPGFPGAGTGSPLRPLDFPLSQAGRARTQARGSLFLIPLISSHTPATSPCIFFSSSSPEHIVHTLSELPAAWIFWTHPSTLVYPLAVSLHLLSVLVDIFLDSCRVGI